MKSRMTMVLLAALVMSMSSCQQDSTPDVSTDQSIIGDFPRDRNLPPDRIINCRENTSRPCYSGPPGTEGVGECKSGIQSCFGGHGGGHWEPCKNEVTPSPEKCDNKDNDCDGKADEGGVCPPGHDGGSSPD